ncbi:GTP pyrophosphokinase [Rhizobium laguerreae]|uniref:GTP pyrophosphokinase n=1 Tax=Rhizobium laguerreae TaxID=1076926 RepID=UPI001C92AF63|nr:hypothetical protein [Rhizobium laguerreae]MBY3381688.1 (p)ppGpp synthetase [Rhizobium laguerreae]
MAYHWVKGCGFGRYVVPLDAKMIFDCVEEYSNSHDRMTKLVLFVVAQFERELKKRNIMARVTGRAKSIESLKGKLDKWSSDRKRCARFRARSDVFSCVSDLAGVRVMTYTERDREVVQQLIGELFASPAGRAEFAAERKEESARIQRDKTNHYRATHMQICLRPEHLVGDYVNLRGAECEVQITSMLAHVWNEIEHDMRYKGDAQALSDDEILAIDSLGLLTKSGDRIISKLINANARRIEAHRLHQGMRDGSIKDWRSLAQTMEEHFGATVARKAINYRVNTPALFDTIEALNLTHPKDLFQVLSPSLVQTTAKETLPAFTRYLRMHGLQKPLIASETCDLFLIALLSKFCATIAGLPKTNRGPAKRHIFFAGVFSQFETTIAV